MVVGSRTLVAGRPEQHRALAPPGGLFRLARVGDAKDQSVSLIWADAEDRLHSTHVTLDGPDDSGFARAFNALRAAAKIATGSEPLGVPAERNVDPRPPGELSSIPRFRNTGAQCFLNALLTQLFVMPTITGMMFDAGMRDAMGDAPVYHALLAAYSASRGQATEQETQQLLLLLGFERVLNNGTGPLLHACIQEAVDKLMDSLNDELGPVCASLGRASPLDGLAFGLRTLLRCANERCGAETYGAVTKARVLIVQLPEAAHARGGARLSLTLPELLAAATTTELVERTCTAAGCGCTSALKSTLVTAMPTAGALVAIVRRSAGGVLFNPVFVPTALQLATTLVGEEAAAALAASAADGEDAVTPRGDSPPPEQAARLVSVGVYQAGDATGDRGHYITYIRLADGSYARGDDSRVSVVAGAQAMSEIETGACLVAYSWSALAPPVGATASADASAPPDAPPKTPQLPPASSPAVVATPLGPPPPPPPLVPTLRLAARPPPPDLYAALLASSSASTMAAAPAPSPGAASADAAPPPASAVSAPAASPNIFTVLMGRPPTRAASAPAPQVNAPSAPPGSWVPRAPARAGPPAPSRAVPPARRPRRTVACVTCGAEFTRADAATAVAALHAHLFATNHYAVPPPYGARRY